MNIRRQNGNFQFEDDPCSKNAPDFSKTYHEETEFLQTKPQVKILNINYYDLFYTVVNEIDDKEKTNIKNENIENDFFLFLKIS